MRVTHEGMEYVLTEEPAADNHGTGGAVRYRARATGPDGGAHVVEWDTTPEWDEACELARLEDERSSRSLTDEELARAEDLAAKDLPDCSDDERACDWDAPVAVRAL